MEGRIADILKICGAWLWLIVLYYTDLFMDPILFSIKEFCRAIATNYLKLGQGSRVMRRRQLSFPSTSRTQVAHDYCLNQQNHMLGKRDKQRRCQYQSCKGKPLTYYINRKVTLCISCFPKYHRQCNKIWCDKVFQA